MRDVFTSLLVLSITSSASAAPLKPTPKPVTSLAVTSKAFANNTPIPVEYTCEGGETRPPLAWTKAPKATKTITILVDDPEATNGTFMHWLVTGLPATATSLGAKLPTGAIEQKNDKGLRAYAGPCPPTGRHHYQFRVYALDIATPAAMTRAEFLKAIDGHVVAIGQLVGTYQKQKR